MCSAGPTGFGKHQLGDQADPVAPLNFGRNAQFANAGCVSGCSADSQGKGDGCKVLRSGRVAGFSVPFIPGFPL